jgi:hypothetical protein
MAVCRDGVTLSLWLVSWTLSTGPVSFFKHCVSETGTVFSTMWQDSCYSNRTVGRPSLQPRRHLCMPYAWDVSLVAARIEGHALLCNGENVRCVRGFVVHLLLSLQHSEMCSVNTFRGQDQVPYICSNRFFVCVICSASDVYWDMRSDSF